MAYFLSNKTYSRDSCNDVINHIDNSATMQYGSALGGDDTSPNCTQSHPPTGWRDIAKRLASCAWNSAPLEQRLAFTGTHVPSGVSHIQRLALTISVPTQPPRICVEMPLACTELPLACTQSKYLKTEIKSNSKGLPCKCRTTTQKGFIRIY